MILADLTPGDRVFVDANIFVYALLGDPQFGQPCQAFFLRIARGEISASSSALTLSNVAHRLMTIEACETFGWNYTGIVRQLQRHPDNIRQLSKYRQLIDNILATAIDVWPVGPQDIGRAAEISQSHGLLSGDALVVASMRSHGVSYLASNDRDFDGVPGVSLVLPH